MAMNPQQTKVVLRDIFKLPFFASFITVNDAYEVNEATTRQALSSDIVCYQTV